VIWIAALLLLGSDSSVPFQSSGTRSTAELQRQMDEIVGRCEGKDNLRAKAMGPNAVGIDFADPPSDLSKDKVFSCVMAEAEKLQGVTFAVVGREQYLDEEGKRH
jgi:hypothetical protein